MIKREDFMFAVGFDGSTAIVDGDARRRHGHDSIEELVEHGLFRPAICAAVYDSDPDALERIRDAYQKAGGSRAEDPEDLLKIFGIPTQVLTSLQDGAADRFRVQVI